MSLNKKELGQFYTTNSNFILGDLKEFIKKSDIIVDPFSGNWDLLNLFPDNKVIGYDIYPLNKDTIKKDTLREFIDIKDKTIITNPPWLANNKTNKHKEIFDMWNVDDLYKAAIRMIICGECKNGILILPLNFLTSKRDNVKIEFLNNYNILKTRVFNFPVFNDTSYTTIAFYFERKDNNNLVDIYKNIISYVNIGAVPECPFWDEIQSIDTDMNVGRLLEGDTITTNLYLKAIDDKTLINLSISKPYFGKISDRSYATITLDKKISKEEEIYICNEFNRLLNLCRIKYNSMFLTNYRENGRKRITFKEAYNLIKYIIYNINGDK